MAIPRFTRDEDKDEINPVEWLRMVKENCKTPFTTSLKLDDEYFNQWYSLDEGTR